MGEIIQNNRKREKLERRAYQAGLPGIPVHSPVFASASLINGQTINQVREDEPEDVFQNTGLVRHEYKIEFGHRDVFVRFGGASGDIRSAHIAITGFTSESLLKPIFGPPGVLNLFSVPGMILDIIVKLYDRDNDWDPNTLTWDIAQNLDVAISTENGTSWQPSQATIGIRSGLLDPELIPAQQVLSIASPLNVLFGIVGDIPKNIIGLSVSITATADATEVDVDTAIAVGLVKIAGANEGDPDITLANSTFAITGPI